MTEKQKQLIADMNESAYRNNAIIPSFRGSTKGEAYDYICRHYHEIFHSAYSPHEDAGDRI